MNKILLTGATGFIGSALLEKLVEVGRVCILPVREQKNLFDKKYEIVNNFDLANPVINSFFLKDVSSVVHVAGRAHVMRESSEEPLDEFRRINVQGTLYLARQAAEAGVNRFVFISSIGVNGTINITPFTENDTPNPAESYAVSKYEAELALLQLAEETGMEVVIIRPPLVYGPNAPGNFGSLLNWVNKGIPLPLGAIHNKRSFVALDNLVDLIITCIDHSAAANQVFLAGDGEDLSTTELLQRVSKAMGKPSWLIPVPEGLLNFGAALFGKKALAQRLLGSLQVDISKARTLLGWEPPVSVDEGLKRVIEGNLPHSRD